MTLGAPATPGRAIAGVPARAASAKPRRASRMTRARIRATDAADGDSRTSAYRSSRRSSSSSAPSETFMWSSIVRDPRPVGSADLRSKGERLVVDVEMAPQRTDRPELETPNGSFLLAHRLGRLAGREAGEEPERDDLALLFGQLAERGRHRVKILANDRDLVRTCVSVRALRDHLQVGVLVAGPDVIDDRVPGQPEQPAPEGHAP